MNRVWLPVYAPTHVPGRYFKTGRALPEKMIFWMMVADGGFDDSFYYYYSPLK
jgi:hypothetical protein